MNTLAQDLFVQAHELEPAAREAFLAQACGENAELHLEVQRVLVDAARADSFFGDADGFPERPAAWRQGRAIEPQLSQPRARAGMEWAVTCRGSTMPDS